MSRLGASLTRIMRGDHVRDMASRVFFAFISWIWVLQIIAPWWDAWQAGPWGARIVVTGLVFAFLGAYTYTIFRMNFFRRSWTDLFSVRERWILRVTTFAVAITLTIWREEAFAPALIFAVITAILTSWPYQANIVLIQSLAVVAVVLVISGVELPMLASVLAFAAVFGFLVAGQMRQMGWIGEIMDSRYAEVRAAAVEERLRIARDLHDVLGHSLSLITLKSELAGRLVENDPARAKMEILQVEELARSATGDVRRTVAGERRPILTVEIGDARELLSAAGIVLHVEGDDIPLPEAISTVFAWGVREGVTNVVRHSRARHCRITVSRGDEHAILTVLDDGAVGSGHQPAGTGLTSLRERAEQLGGTMSFGVDPDGSGHRLQLTVPIPSTEPEA